MIYTFRKKIFLHTHGLPLQGELAVFPDTCLVCLTQIIVQIMIDAILNRSNMLFVLMFKQHWWAGLEKIAFANKVVSVFLKKDYTKTNIRH